MSDAALDLNEFPTDVDVPSSLTSAEGSELDTGIQLLQFPFCLLFNGRSWMTISVAAPSPELAAATMDQYVNQVLNPGLVRMGYPRNVCAWRAGECS
jgi:hypothetical protein